MLANTNVFEIDFKRKTTRLKYRLCVLTVFTLENLSRYTLPYPRELIKLAVSGGGRKFPLESVAKGQRQNES